MDRATARAEAALFAGTPGARHQRPDREAADPPAHRRRPAEAGEKFRLRDVHHFLFAGGDVPVSLL